MVVFREILVHLFEDVQDVGAEGLFAGSKLLAGVFVFVCDLSEVPGNDVAEKILLCGWDFIEDSLAEVCQLVVGFLEFYQVVEFFKISLCDIFEGGCSKRECD